MKLLLQLSVLVSLFFSFAARGQTFKPQQITFFEKKIRPILAKHCFECHSDKAKKLEGGLRLDHRKGFIEGGTSGKPVALPGAKLAQTRLFQVVRLKHIEKERIHPPLAKLLTITELKSLGAWVQIKLPYPEASGSNALAEKKPVTDWKEKFDWDKARSFWAFQKPKSHKVPQPKQIEWIRSDIDRFLLAKLEATGLSPVKAVSYTHLRAHETLR